MGLRIKEFLVEFNRNLIEFRRGYLWLLGLLAFAVLGIYYFYIRPNSLAGIGVLPDSVFSYSFYAQSYGTGIFLITIILSAMLIAVDRESGIWKISRSLKLPDLPSILAKFAWIIVYSIIGLAVSLMVFSLYFFTNYAHFNFSYIVPFAMTLLSFIPVSAIIAMQGLTISSMFSKRVTAVMAAIAFYAFVSSASVFYFNHYVVNQNPSILFNTNFPVFYKIIILMDPVYFKYLAAALLGITMIGYGNYNNGNVPPPKYQFYVPAIFNSYQGYLTMYLIEFSALILLMYISMSLRRRMM